MHPSKAALAPTADDTAATPSRPADSDVVVSRLSASSGHTVGQYPGDPQFTAASREEAIRLANSFARRHGLDVWFREGRTYLRIETFRNPPAGS
jgi:hypothetical protein